jgi:glutathione S-transferase
MLFENGQQRVPFQPIKHEVPMKLYYSTASPYARTAQVTLREVGLESEAIEQQTHPFNNEPEFVQANPLGKVPCLVLEHGESLYDSEVICQYLDFKFNRERLWQPISNSWTLRTRYSQVSGLLDISVALRQEKMRQEEGLRSEFWWQRFNLALERGIEDLASAVNRFPSALTLLHINTICLLDYLSFRHPEINWQQFDSLSELFNQYAHRPSFVSTKPKA